jgi:DNA-binding NarL/FixJ family response regulator
MSDGSKRNAPAATPATPNSAIVMLTVSRSDSDLFDALRAGAVGYLLKDIDPDRLPLALRGVLQGEAALPRHLVALLIDEFRRRDRRPRLRLVRRDDADLTSEDWEVLELMRNGLRTSEIAEALDVDRVVVKTRTASILRKLRAPDRETAVRLIDG